jgi:hypothetical protein
MVSGTFLQQSKERPERHFRAARTSCFRTNVPYCRPLLQSQKVSPRDVVPLDSVTRVRVDEDMYRRFDAFGVEVTLQSAEAYYAFRPELAADRISPRPLLIVHGIRNALHPIDEARSLYAHAREPKELIEIPEGHHLGWIEPGHPLYLATIPRIVNWFRQHLPV